MLRLQWTCGRWRLHDVNPVRGNTLTTMQLNAPLLWTCVRWRCMREAPSMMRDGQTGVQVINKRAKIPLPL